MAGVASRRLPLARLQRRLTIFFPSWSPRREDVCEAHGTWSLLTLLGTRLGRNGWQVRGCAQLAVLWFNRGVVVVKSALSGCSLGVLLSA